MKLGGLDISTVKLGANQVQAVYQGVDLVWQNAPVATAATGVGATSFTANWNAYTGAVVYLLDVSESSDFSTFVYEDQQVNAPTTSYVVIGLNPNTTYYYRVRASTEALTDADYQAVLDYATTQGYTLPSASQQLLQNQLLVDLKNGGIWAKLDTLAVFATDGDEDFALIDWKRLSQFTAVNSPTFTTNVGFSGNGTSAYVDTNFNPSTSGVNYTLNNAGRIMYGNFPGDSGYPESAGGGQENITRSSSGNTRQRINQGTANANLGFLPPSALGFDALRALYRTSATNVEIFGGTTQVSATANSTIINNNSQNLLRAFGNFSSSSNIFKIYGMGASLVSENTDLYNALNTYITSL
jgi:hypothetical protein